MGTTLVAALLRGDRAVLAHVGDSPAFLVRARTARRLTQDHSWVAQAVARGHLDPEEADSHPYRHVLTRALGSMPSVDVDVSEELTLEPGDVLVLCSDGLVRHVDEDELAQVVSDRPSQAAAAALVDLANERGGEDNITVIVCQVAADPDAATAPDADASPDPDVARDAEST
jgi:protein phosphatase